VQITLNTYAHVLPEMQQGAADRLGAVLHGDQAGIYLGNGYASEFVRFGNLQLVRRVHEIA